VRLTSGQGMRPSFPVNPEGSCSMRRLLVGVLLCVAAALAVPATGLSFSTTITARAQGTGSAQRTGSAPTDAYIICSMYPAYTLVHSGVAFSGETNCGGFPMAALYGKASIVNTASGNQASCNVCTDVKSSGSATLVAGFPYTFRYETTLQIPSGWKWDIVPPGCVRATFYVLSCTFNYNFTAT
jgi:hypothetical protein